MVNPKIAELEAEIAKLKKDQAEFDALPESFQLADILHARMCQLDHTESCGWFYTDWESYSMAAPNSTRKSWVRKAELMLAVEKFETILNIIRLL